MSRNCFAIILAATILTAHQVSAQDSAAADDRNIATDAAVSSTVTEAAATTGVSQASTTQAPLTSASSVSYAPLPVSTTGAVTAAASPAAAMTTIDLATAYQIGPEDVLDISVWKNPELSRTVPVRPDGKVSLPLVNDIQAAGLTPSDLRDQVTERLTEFVPAPEVSVIVREVHSRKVAVVGAVKTPGRYELKSPMTVLEVLALAQGLTDFADRERIVVLRQSDGKTTRIPFNYRKIADSAQQDNFLIRPGDIVVVP